MSALAIIANLVTLIVAWLVCEVRCAPTAFETDDGFGPVEAPPQAQQFSPELRVQGKAGRVHEHAFHAFSERNHG